MTSPRLAICSGISALTMSRFGFMKFPLPRLRLAIGTLGDNQGITAAGKVTRGRCDDRTRTDIDLPILAHCVPNVRFADEIADGDRRRSGNPHHSRLLARAGRGNGTVARTRA